MMEATAKLLKGDNQLGTAWMLDHEHALTDWHCVADPAHLRLLHTHVDLAFVIGRDRHRVKAEVIDHDVRTDAALLRLVDRAPPGMGTIRLGPRRDDLEAFFRQSPLEWHAYAYPREAGGQGVMLNGRVDNLRGSFDEAKHICPVIQISVVGADVDQLKAASGSAVCIQEHAVALIRYTPLGEGKIIFATPLDEIAERFARVKELLPYRAQRTSVRHLACGREQQWQAIEHAITTGEPRASRQVFFVYGARGEKPELFEERVKLLDDREHLARCEQVQWIDGVAPASEADFLAATSRSLLRREELDRQHLGGELSRLARGRRAGSSLRKRLVMILPTLRVAHLGDVLTDDRFARLHGQWLPDLLAHEAFGQADCAGVVVLQSLEYPSTWWRWPPWLNKVDRLARRLAACVEEHRRRQLASDLLGELRRLTVDEIERFLALTRNLPEPQRVAILSYARTCSSSSEFYDFIKDKLPDE
jgi:hypothetical protein